MKLPQTLFLGSILLLQGISLAVGKAPELFMTFSTSTVVWKHSDVTIDCTFTAQSYLRDVNIIWYFYCPTASIQVFNSKDPSEVAEGYRGRTSLVPGPGSCTLKIRDVTQAAYYYPVISIGGIHYFNQGKYAKVDVAGCPENPACQGWRFIIPEQIEVMKGSCVEIPCTVYAPPSGRLDDLFWYFGSQSFPKAFNLRTPTEVAEEYKGRTHMKNFCSLTIYNIQKEEQYFPGVNTAINAGFLHGTVTRITLAGQPPVPSIKGNTNMEENKATDISCAVYHTCASSPPILTWNIDGHQENKTQEDQNSGYWKMASTISYIPSYTDDKRMVECRATFPNNQTSSQRVELNVKYAPKSVVVSLVESMKTKEGLTVTLRCSGIANPSLLQYFWYELRQNWSLLPEQSDTLTMTDVTTQHFACAATNTIGFAHSPVFAFTDQDNSVTKKPLFVFLGIFFLLLFAVLIYFGWRLYQRPPTPGQPDNSYCDVGQPDTIYKYDDVDQQLNYENISLTGGKDDDYDDCVNDIYDATI